MALPTEIHPFSLGGNDVNTFKSANSLRFRSGNSAYLSRTPSGAGNRTTWTWSGWVKRGSLSVTNGAVFFGAYDNSSATDATYTGFTFTSSDTLSISGWSQNWRTTTQVFRDPSAWYHIIVVLDTGNATASNRVKLYVNGSEVTSFGTTNNPTLNQQLGINSVELHTLGRINYLTGSGPYSFDGYLAEVNFIDGQVLTPSAFGRTDVLTGAWQPKKYSGSYGTNGFYLPFNTSSTSTFAGTFNGSSQYLTTATSTNLALGTSDFTIEYWVNFTAATNGGTVCCAGSGATSYDGLFGYVNSSQLQTYLTSTGGSWDVASARVVISSITLGRWYHIAYTRSGSTFRVFVDGTQVDTFTSAASLYQSGNQFSLCRGQNTGLINGLLSNVRVIKGTALYTSNFVPSISPLTAVTNTQLLTLQNSTIIDNSPNALSITNTGSVAMSVNTPWATQTVGTDSSGNNNQWTSSGITVSSSANTLSTTHDVYTDVPANWDDGGNGRGNYAVLNSIVPSGGTYSEGNLRYVGPSAWRNTFATIGLPTSGKWYFEAIVSATAFNNTLNGAYSYIGIATPSVSLTTSGASAANFVVLTDTGFLNNNGTNTNVTSAALVANDIIGVAIDVSANTFAFYRNNTIVASGTIGMASGTPLVFVNGSFNDAYGGFRFNFGQRPFAYKPPSGFLALNTYNLPNPSLPLV